MTQSTTVRRNRVRLPGRNALVAAALLLCGLAAGAVLTSGESAGGPRAVPPQFPLRPGGKVDASAEGIARLVRDLGAADPAAREAASARLFWCGKPARDALAAAASENGGGTPAPPEVAARARALVRLIDAYNALEPVSVPYMLRGYCYARSAAVDDKALGGFGPSDNMHFAAAREDAARTLGGDWAEQYRLQDGRVYLLARPDEPAAFGGKYQGFALYLVNATGARAAFEASDSRLSIVQEAKDADGKWKPVEYLPSSWCGNSYHRVFLGRGQAWRFIAPRYTGPVRTKLRFALLRPEEKAKQPVYSNEFDGSIHPEQFTTKQGHKPTNIMDPYLD